MPSSTIFALSSGHLPSGVAVIRISGPESSAAADLTLGGELKPRLSSLRKLTDPNSGEVIDEVLSIWFPGPKSFTGEDVLEFHCHGGVATVSKVLDMLSAIPGLRMAEAGEFSRRAFENGRFDLTELEGLSDLISAKTEKQRRQASAQAGGELRLLCEKWRAELIQIRSHIEAEIDFIDEGDVDESEIDLHRSQIWELKRDISSYLYDHNRGEIVRTGFNVVLAGPPNVGKSSLLNALAKRDVAIVTPHAGTTRDIVQVELDIDGYLVVVSDTAGIRDTGDEIEQAGIERSRSAIQNAHLTLWLYENEAQCSNVLTDAIIIQAKADLLDVTPKNTISISTVGQPGIDSVIKIISSACGLMKSGGESILISRRRYRNGLEATVAALQQALAEEFEPELISEQLRVASEAIGCITGKIDVEDLLDVIFSEFCIGK